MRKFAVVLIACLLISQVAFALDVTLTIPDEKVDNAVACLKWYGVAQYHLEQGDEETDAQFAKRTLRQIVISLDQRYRGLVASQQAQQSVVADNGLVEE